MSAKWTWIFGIATGASFVLALVFFAATQSMTGRDAFAVVIGLIFGATLTAFVSTFIFHRDTRTRSIGEQTALSAKKLDLISALPTRAEEIARLTTVVAELDAQAAMQDGERRSLTASAQESADHGFQADAERETGQANAALHLGVGLRARREEASKDLDRIKGISDDAFLAELQHLRGLA